jgi:flagellar hook-basal body complex protein FliE
MIKINANVNPIQPRVNSSMPGAVRTKKTPAGSGFADTIKAVGKEISKVNDLQEASDISVKDLLSGKNEDITSMVSAVAKADMSFKLLVGVRNKLIEAYKQTMNMPL